MDDHDVGYITKSEKKHCLYLVTFMVHIPSNQSIKIGYLNFCSFWNCKPYWLLFYLEWQILQSSIKWSVRSILLCLLFGRKISISSIPENIHQFCFSWGYDLWHLGGTWFKSSKHAKFKLLKESNFCLHLIV
jgi:hypothetical protein